MPIKVNKKGTEKWQARASIASEDYADGINNPRRSWAQATKEAKNAWFQGISAANSNNSFEKGINKAGDSKWQRRALDLGKSRYAQGVMAAGSEYANGIAPYLAVLEGLNLKARGRKGDVGNLDRVATVCNALRAKKMGG